MTNDVKAWNESITLPTYPIGEPEKYPMFLEKRVYQGSSGAVYPFPVIEKIYDEKTERPWQAVFLENDFLKIMILPQLGGRVQMAYDKMKQRHFVYYNQVIKPALVGLTGPWISGGIEFNWPQHHRPTTYEPVDFTIEEHSDGSRTVWVNEIDRMFGTKGKAGFRLYPDKAYLEINAELYNRTPFPQTFLWWANPAVPVNDNYQSIFPPDVHAVYDHGKRDVSRFPIATGTYYKVDYSAGVDISRYKNIPVPTSYMAVGSQYDFIGGYEHDTHGGLMHVANHHIAPGKKQWTWGNGDFGHAWDRNLTDEDGPYVELMCGVYTDNQPDFSWMQPYEIKQFTEYFMPYQELGPVKNANRDAMVNLELDDGKATIKLYTTGFFPEVRLMLLTRGQKIWEDQHNFAPGTVYQQKVNVSTEISLPDLKVVALTKNQCELIAWQAEPSREDPLVPDPAKPALEPEEIENTELLYLNGLHLEQYRHATYQPTDYYREALRRDPGDIRNNIALGVWLMRRAQFSEAEQHFRKALETLTIRNPNPYDGEAFYHLGICLKLQAREGEAYEMLYKAAWSAAWQNAAYFHIARLDARRKDWERALTHTEKSLMRNSHHHQARHLKTVLLRKLGRESDALTYTEESLRLDAFNMGALYEKYLLTRKQPILDEFLKLMRNHSFNFINFALDYAHGGFCREAMALLSYHQAEEDQANPLINYLLGWFAGNAGDEEVARSYFSKAGAQKPDFGFTNRLEEVLALQRALEINPQDCRAHYFLGNFYYAYRQHQLAVTHWERAADLEDDNSITYRNLALAYFNKLYQPEKALQFLEQAFRQDQGSARLLMELDQLYKRLNYPVQDRLNTLEKYSELVDFRDDLYLSRVTLYNMLGQYEKALNLLSHRMFHPWEGGEGKVPAQYVYCRIALAVQHIEKQGYHCAIDHLVQAQTYPHNLGEGKLYGTQENDIFYWMGCAYDGLGETEKARAAWEQASVGLSEPEPAIFYNDQQPDKIFYQGLALLKLNRQEEAYSRFNKLISFAEERYTQTVKIDYFAVSLPDLLLWDDDLQARNSLFCHYLIGLGHLGLGQSDKAIEHLQKAGEIDIYHQGVHWHRQMAESGRLVDIP
jgi:tetratricopeptide (TPR) repeat protein